MSTAFGWKSAWETNDPHAGDVLDERGEFDYYDLPEQDYSDESKRYRPNRIYPGDRFWFTDDRVMVEIDDVKTKIYQGVVGYQGEEGNDCVFYTPDWTEPQGIPQTREAARAGDWRSEIQFWSVDDFVEMLDEGTLVAHAGNGLPPLP